MGGAALLRRSVLLSLLRSVRLAFGSVWLDWRSNRLGSAPFGSDCVLLELPRHAHPLSTDHILRSLAILSRSLLPLYILREVHALRNVTLTETSALRHMPGTPHDSDTYF